MQRKYLFTGILSFALACAFLFTSCPVEGPKKPKLTNAGAPIITFLYGDGVYDQNVEIELKFNAVSPDGGWLGWQWYQLPEIYAIADKGTMLDSQDSFGTESDMPPDEAVCTVSLATPGVYNYVVEVTNNNAEVSGDKSTSTRSTAVTVCIDDPASAAKYPRIIRHPENGKQPEGEAILDVEATVPDGGNLTYQWYSNTANSNLGGTALAGGTSATYTSAALKKGEYYFYVTVTNTNGGQTKSVTSRPARIEIVAVPEANATVTLNANVKNQYVRGFGGMDIPWGNFFSITEAEYEKMYHPVSGLGFNIMRIMIMPENGEETDNTNPAATIDYYVNGDRPNYIKGAKIVNKHGGYLLASPWSPPPEWKSNGSILAGGSANLLPTYYSAYANYLKGFAQAMADRGAPIYAVSIQNEPNYEGNYDGCHWTGAQMRDFFKASGVGRFTEGVGGWGGGKAIPRVLIMNGESANTPATNDEALTDATSRDFIDLIARHNYGNLATLYSNEQRYGKEMWMTEFNINSGNATNYPNDLTWNYVWTFLNDVDLTIRQRNENAYVWWALKRFYSFIGDGQYGATEGVVLPRGYALSHYAKFAKEKYRINAAVRGTLKDTTPIGASNVNNTNINRDNTAVRVTAFISEDGNELSVVMYTPTGSDGTGGHDLGTVKIDMPSGFVAVSATAMRSTSKAKGVTEEVILSADRKSAIVELPRSEILSVKFTKKQ